MAEPANLAVVDRDGSALSQALEAYLADMHNVADVADDEYTLQDALATNTVDAVVIVPEGFGSDCLAAARAGSEALVWELSEELVLSPAQAAMDRARHRARTRARIFLMISLLLYRWGARFSGDRPGIENGPIILSAWGKVNQTGGKQGRL